MAVDYRREGDREKARLLYDPARVDPAAWLADRIGDVTILAAAPAPAGVWGITIVPRVGLPSPISTAPPEPPDIVKRRVLAAYRHAALLSNCLRVFGGAPAEEPPAWPGPMLFAVLNAPVIARACRSDE